jgi:transcriptional regulator with XRE-family HTH domain
MMRGEAMRAARKRAGLSLEQLAEKVGVAVNTIGRMERGDSGGSIDTIEWCAGALGITVDEYIGQAEPKRKSPVSMEAVELTYDGTTGEYTAKQGSRILGKAGTLAEITDVIRCRVDYS